MVGEHPLFLVDDGLRKTGWRHFRSSQSLGYTQFHTPQLGMVYSSYPIILHDHPTIIVL